jgi:hypothetical protein
MVNQAAADGKLVANQPKERTAASFVGERAAAKASKDNDVSGRITYSCLLELIEGRTAHELKVCSRRAS